MAPQSPWGPHEHPALLLLSTEQKVHAYDLASFSRIGIGRHESNEIQLTSRTVSNFHAEILKEGPSLFVRDLGSTNGTMVNGAKVDRVPLSPGDSIKIGGHVLSLQLQAAIDSANARGLDAREADDSPRAGARGSIVGLKARAVESTGDTPPPTRADLTISDLLRRVAARGEPLQAIVEREGRRARLLFHERRLFHAELESASGEKALYRLFSWQHGSYSIEPLPDPASAPVTICLPLDALVVEGMDQALELGRLVASLPPLATPLRLKEDCPLPLTSHSPAEIEVFQAIIRHETIERVLEKSPWTDVRVLRLIDSLLRKGVFEVGTMSGLDETSSLPV